MEMYPMHLQAEFSTAAYVRHPVQCEGATRGPERIAEMAASGGVSPQINWGDVIKTVGGGLLSML
jgi:hypothetical protein